MVKGENTRLGLKNETVENFITKLGAAAKPGETLQENYAWKSSRQIEVYNIRVTLQKRHRNRIITRQTKPKYGKQTSECSETVKVGYARLSLRQDLPTYNRGTY